MIADCRRGPKPSANRVAGMAYRDGPLGDRSLPGKLIGLHSGVLPQTPPHPRTSEVGRFLRKRRFDEHDRDTALSVAGALDNQRHGDGPLGDRSLPGILIRPHSGVLPQTPPHPRTSEVGRFLRKRRFDEHDQDTALSVAGTLDNQCHGDGLLGDRSLPERVWVNVHRASAVPPADPRTRTPCRARRWFNHRYRGFNRLLPPPMSQIAL